MSANVTTIDGNLYARNVYVGGIHMIVVDSN